VQDQLLTFGYGFSMIFPNFFYALSGPWKLDAKKIQRKENEKKMEENYYFFHSLGLREKNTMKK